MINPKKSIFVNMKKPENKPPKPIVLSTSTKGGYNLLNTKPTKLANIRRSYSRLIEQNIANIEIRKIQHPQGRLHLKSNYKLLQTSQTTPIKKTTAKALKREDAVFINCPFDADFMSLLKAIIFAIHDCGFVASHALQDTGAAEMRLHKICRLVKNSQFSIHDISRTTLTEEKYPRFNMPFEAGLAYAETQLNTANKHDMLVLEEIPYSGKITLSDLAGIDPQAHHNDVKKIIESVRKFLAAKNSYANRAPKTRGAASIYSRHMQFLQDLPGLAKEFEYDIEELNEHDYINDWTQLMINWMVSQ